MVKSSTKKSICTVTEAALNRGQEMGRVLACCNNAIMTAGTGLGYRCMIKPCASPCDRTMAKVTFGYSL